jgi:hypothetical protein
MKKILFTLCLAAALTGARGQIYIDSYRFGAAAECSGLLLDGDCLPDAEFAVSLRKLRTAYTGNCVEVRNASTGRTFTVGFSGDFLDTVRLKDSCLTANCFVRTWYDQSGLGRDATQTTDARQPQITSSGTLYYSNGKVGMRFDGTGTADRLVAGTAGNFNFLHNGTTSTVLFVHRPGLTSSTIGALYSGISTSTDGGSLDLGIGYSLRSDFRAAISRNRQVNNVVGRGVVNTFAVLNETAQNAIDQNEINLYVDFLDADNATAANRSYLYINDLAVTQANTYSASVSASNSDIFHIGASKSDGNVFNGEMHEIILFDIDYSAKLSSLKTNINNFYSIW